VKQHDDDTTHDAPAFLALLCSLCLSRSYIKLKQCTACHDMCADQRDWHGCRPWLHDLATTGALHPVNDEVAVLTITNVLGH
jgi:hypothetical protein